ncbi:hypothetical protein TIFTF001_021738 [Ficus carica]|uniref:3'-5' exonuclease domain-containing protein n=1 Tax=Ficus carica TaxID=3494 RepID=A0AA88ASX1_FICCA|nr:hypothetical protein TIFTF001_021738 [Ficus carica]
MACSDDNNKEKFKTYDIEFYEHRIKTMVTANPQSVDQWISELYQIHKNKHQNKLFVGLDTEWNNPINESKLKNCDQHVTVLQLCTEDRCLILQLSHAKEISQSLVDFLKDKNVTFTGVGINQDAKKRSKDWGLKILLGKVMEMQKDVIESQWEASKGQVRMDGMDGRKVQANVDWTPPTKVSEARRPANAIQEGSAPSTLFEFQILMLRPVPRELS